MRQLILYVRNSKGSVDGCAGVLTSAQRLEKHFEGDKHVGSKHDFGLYRKMFSFGAAKMNRYDEAALPQHGNLIVFRV